MTLKTQKIISAVMVGTAVFGGFELLAVILNLNQVSIYLNTAFWIYGFLLLFMAILFDLHFKNPGALKRAMLRHENVQHRLVRMAKITISAVFDRVSHIHTWKYLKRLLVSFIIPGFAYWATIALLYVNFGNVKLQQAFILLSSLALIAIYWFFKETFSRQKEVVDSDIFVISTVVKIYTSAILFAASISLVRRYCLGSELLVLGTFSFTFLLIYQALVQHKMNSFKNILITLAISLIMAHIGYFILVYWGFNFYTAAAFWTVCYNLFWGIFHYYLDRALTKLAFFEILAVSLLIGFMLFNVTNFKAQLLDACVY